MRVGKRLGIVLASAGVLVFLGVRNQRQTQAYEGAGLVLGRAAAPYVGVPSCSARSCHGADSPAASGNLLRNEYTTWIEADPHAGAYSVLFGERAVRIMKNLADPADAPHAASQDVRCLACHCDPHAAAQAGLARHRIDGVGCEACHGTARNWIDPHTAPPVWDKLTVSEKQQHGMVDVKDPAVMARACAGCHVGSPASQEGGGIPLRDVDHDLLAAGHPRLDFEFATFLANIPAHWKQVAGAPEAERSKGVRAWASGQIASARAALELLADRVARAEGPTQTATWPEFSEYDCSSCHHPLTIPSTRQRLREGSRTLGANSWGNWYLSMPERLLANDPAVSQAFTSLKRHMERPYPPLPATTKLVGEALNALTRIEQRSNQLSNQQLASLALDRLRQPRLPVEPTCWELAEQYSLSAAWLERVHFDEKRPKSVGAESERQRSAAKEAVFGRLASPPGTDGQGSFHWDEAFERDLRALMSAEAQPK